jgi:DNA transformation protein
MSQQTSERRISEMRNLGPACEQDLNAVGVFTADDLIRLGPEDAFVRMLEGRIKCGRSTKCCNASYLYAMYGAVHDLDWRDIPDDVKENFKKFTTGLRRSGRYG